MRTNDWVVKSDRKVSQIEVGPPSPLSQLDLSPLAARKINHHDWQKNILELNSFAMFPSDRLPSVLLELVEFLQLKVRLRQSHQDQDHHQASVQWRGENGKMGTLECPDLMWAGKDLHN